MTSEEKQEIPSPLLLAFARLHGHALGAATGVLMGAGLFLVTIFLVWKGGPAVGPTLGLLRHFFFGYTVTAAGAWIGLLWGFAAGYVLGWGVAVLHNLVVWSWLTIVRSRAEMEQYGDFLDHL